MEQLFIVPRYKEAPVTPAGESKSELFNSALTRLLTEAKNRQEAKDKSKDDILITESPKNLIKRKLFLSPETSLPNKKSKVLDLEKTSSKDVDQDIDINPVMCEKHETRHLDENDTAITSSSVDGGRRKKDKKKVKDVGADMDFTPIMGEEHETNNLEGNYTANTSSSVDCGRRKKDKKIVKDVGPDIDITQITCMGEQHETNNLVENYTANMSSSVESGRRKKGKKKAKKILDHISSPISVEADKTDDINANDVIEINEDSNIAPKSTSTPCEELDVINLTEKAKLPVKYKENKKSSKNKSSFNAEKQVTTIVKLNTPAPASNNINPTLCSKNNDEGRLRKTHPQSKRLIVEETTKSVDGPQNKTSLSSDSLNVGERENFTLIGEVHERTRKHVASTLPYWLANPVIISNQLQDKKMPVTEMPHLHASIVSKLVDNEITHFFPVQQTVIPWVLNRLASANVFRPPDICVSAPTGSGKTLAYLIPILQALGNRLVPLVRAIVLLPVKELAIQVFKVFNTYFAGTELKVALIIGQKSYDHEVESLIRPTVRGDFSSCVDVVIATPSRLIHHIENTSGFSLHNLRFFILDEADRMMEDLQDGWFSVIEKAVQSKKMSSCQCRGKLSSGRFLSGPIIPCCHSRPIEPCQKLLFSATLSEDPEKLGLLSLFYPKLFTCVVEGQNLKGENQGEFIGKFTTPKELTEKFIKCDFQTKPLMVWYLLKQMVYTNALCFTNTVESSHRLCLLLRAFGDVKVQELSSHLDHNQRKNVLNKLSNGKLDILVCSDMMARGMDLDNVNYVICYDTPQYLKTYIHRIGRTARAGRSGTAISLLGFVEMKKFKMLMKTANKSVPKELHIPSDRLVPFENKYKNALGKVAKQILHKEEKKSKVKSPDFSKRKEIRRYEEMVEV